MGNVHVYIHVLKLSPILLTYYRQNSLKCIDGSPVFSRNFLNSHLLTPYSTYSPTSTRPNFNVTFIHVTLRLQEESTLLATRSMQLLSFLSLICSKEERLCGSFSKPLLCRFMFCVWAFQNLASLCSGDPPMCSGKVWHFSPTNLMRW